MLLDAAAAPHLHQPASNTLWTAAATTAQRTMSAFGQKVAAPVRTYEEEMKFLSRNDATSWTIKPGFVPNMRVRRGVPSYACHRRASSPGERVVAVFFFRF